MLLMDRIAQKANQARSVRGGVFEVKITKLLSVMKREKRIKDFKVKPAIFDGEFNPDWIIEKNNGSIVGVDSTTTARTDRLRAKQWDAYGTKLYYKEIKKKRVLALVVVQDDKTTQKEKDNFRRCKSRCRLSHSALDDVVSLKEFIKILEE